MVACHCLPLRIVTAHLLAMLSDHPRHLATLVRTTESSARLSVRWLGLLTLVYAFPAVGGEPVPPQQEASVQLNAPERIVHLSFNEMPNSQPIGKVQIARAGPTPPLFPDFADDNRALELKPPSYLVLPDEYHQKCKFNNDDTITAEAWVNIRSLAENAYIAGKGRTKKSGLKSRDQNWAFRLRKRDGQACVNFLFHSKDNDATAGQFHRWTTDSGFGIDSGWHHVAVRYQFGHPESIAAFIDGRAAKGTWDLGGPTTVPPMTTSSPVWIGSSIDGSKGNSLDGWIDELAIYRGHVADEALKRRYRFVAPVVKRPQSIENSVAVQLFGPFEDHGRRPVNLVVPQRTWQQKSLVLTRLPFKYDSAGVRDDWTTNDKKSMLVRTWADVALEPGEYQMMIRSRGYSELFVDGKRVLSTPKQVNRSGAHHVVDPLPKVAVPGMRPHAMNDHERIVDFQSDGGLHEIRFDVIVGGPKYRLEFGETCIAIARKGEMFHLVSQDRLFPLTDRGWQTVVNDQAARLDKLDRRTREQSGAQQNAFWRKRHEYAKTHLRSELANNATIDSLLQQRIRHENSRRSKHSDGDSVVANDFFVHQVRPILQSHCARCHGEKRQGELSVFDRDNLIRGGESGEPAVTPGDRDQSYLLQLISADTDDYRMPPKGDGLSDDEVAIIRQWIADGALMPNEKKSPVKMTSQADGATFLRRIYLDTLGVPPTLAEAKAFLNSTNPNRRRDLVNHLLDDPSRSEDWASNWVGYWQDVLAENPNLLKPTLNNTGPFRYWIHEALVDNKPMDRFATELIQMRGSKWNGGAGGFAIASQNDVPMAAKAHVIATAFMGVEMKCARCHDAPYHSWKQSDLFHLAAMLERKPIKLPKTSTVPAAFFEKHDRKSLIEVTLKPGTIVHGEWPFAQLAPSVEAELLPTDADTRDRLAAQVTASRRFAEVIANRVWTRLMGAAMVDPVDDWEGNPPSDPRLLAHLTDTLIENDYDLKELARSIFLSDAYGKKALPTVDEGRFFAGPYRRRMSAEQIVDSAFQVAGQAMKTEQLTMDVEGTLPADRFLNFGFPQRAWEFTTLANERDRPSLALPRIQAITDVLRAFGWRNSRPEPTSKREEMPNLVQPGALANGTLGIWLTRLSDQSGLTQMMLRDQALETLVDDLFLRMLTRYPNKTERAKFVDLLRKGYGDRILQPSLSDIAQTPKRFPYVSWSNHLNTEANVIKVQMTELARQGPPPTQRLAGDWRARAEDAVWALLNSPEMMVIP